VFITAKQLKKIHQTGLVTKRRLADRLMPPGDFWEISRNNIMQFKLELKIQFYIQHAA